MCAQVAPLLAIPRMLRLDLYLLRGAAETYRWDQWGEGGFGGIQHENVHGPGVFVAVPLPWLAQEN